MGNFKENSVKIDTKRALNEIKQGVENAISNGLTGTKDISFTGEPDYMKHLLTYQKICTLKAIERLDNDKDVALGVFTGGGKTEMAKSIIMYYSAFKPIKILWIAPATALENIKIDFIDEWNNTYREKTGNIDTMIHTISTEKISLAESAERKGKPIIAEIAGAVSEADIIIYDEAHKMMANNRNSILKTVINKIVANRRKTGTDFVGIIAMTATPKRSIDKKNAFKKGVVDLPDDEVIWYTIVDAEKNGDTMPISVVNADGVIRNNTEIRREAARLIDYSKHSLSKAITDKAAQLSRYLTETGYEEQLEGLLETEIGDVDKLKAGQIHLFYFNSIKASEEANGGITAAFKNYFSKFETGTKWTITNRLLNGEQSLSSNNAIKNMLSTGIIDDYTVELVFMVAMGTESIHPKNLVSVNLMENTTSNIRYDQIMGRGVKLSGASTSTSDIGTYFFNDFSSFEDTNVPNYLIGRDRLADRATASPNFSNYDFTEVTEEQLDNGIAAYNRAYNQLFKRCVQAKLATVREEHRADGLTEEQMFKEAIKLAYLSNTYSISDYTIKKLRAVDDLTDACATEKLNEMFKSIIKTFKLKENKINTNINLYEEVSKLVDVKITEVLDKITSDIVTGHELEELNTERKILDRVKVLYKIIRKEITVTGECREGFEDVIDYIKFNLYLPLNYNKDSKDSNDRAKEIEKLVIIINKENNGIPTRTANELELLNSLAIKTMAGTIDTNIKNLINNNSILNSLIKTRAEHIDVKSIYKNLGGQKVTGKTCKTIEDEYSAVESLMGRNDLDWEHKRASLNIFRCNNETDVQKVLTKVIENKYPEMRLAAGHSYNLSNIEQVARLIKAFERLEKINKENKKAGKQEETSLKLEPNTLNFFTNLIEEFEDNKEKGIEPRVKLDKTSMFMIAYQWGATETYSDIDKAFELAISRIKRNIKNKTEEYKNIKKIKNGYIDALVEANLAYNIDNFSRDEAKLLEKKNKEAIKNFDINNDESVKVIASLVNTMLNDLYTIYLIGTDEAHMEEFKTKINSKGAEIQEFMNTSNIPNSFVASVPFSIIGGNTIDVEKLRKFNKWIADGMKFDASTINVASIKTEEKSMAIAMRIEAEKQEKSKLGCACAFVDSMKDLLTPMKELVDSKKNYNTNSNTMRFGNNYKRTQSKVSGSIKDRIGFATKY